MSRFRTFLNKLQKQEKYAASNPLNFEETWSFTASRIQLISLIAILCVVIGVLFTLFVLKGPFSSLISKNDTSIERHELEKQQLEIMKLTKALNDQTAYIETIKHVLSGKSFKETSATDLPETPAINPAEINTSPSENELKLAEQVKSDLRTTSKKKQTSIQFFAPPISGVVSQKFSLSEHAGVDIVATRDKNVLACLSGTIIYSGYTPKDGYILILDHANGYVSVYKHNKTNLKKTGAKVQMNDPIAIVGNTGENSNGPHLHFELWYNQSAVNPEDYMRFSMRND